jgi:hypothetical protein
MGRRDPASVPCTRGEGVRRKVAPSEVSIYFDVDRLGLRNRYITQYGVEMVLNYTVLSVDICCMLGLEP